MSFWTDVRNAALPALVTAFVPGAAAFSWTLFAQRTAFFYVLGQASKALAKNPSNIQQQSRTITAKEATAPHRVVYGRTRIAGNIVYMEGTSSNKYLHMVITLAAHEIDAVESVYFNDQEVIFASDTGLVTSDNYKNKARIRYKLGTSSQTAFSELVAESDDLWTDNHRLRGIACLYVRLEYDANKYPNGIPNITAVIRGKKVYDPRTLTTAYSSNPALCLADYLTDSLHGVGAVYADEIDETALITAADVCDETVERHLFLPDEIRYSMNGSYDSNVTAETVINNILISMAGKAVWSGGKWRIIAGSYTTPTLTFDEGDLRSGLKVQTLVSRRELFNGVKGTFASPDNNWVLSDFPPVISSTFKTQDNGEEILKNVEFLFTTSSSMAQRLAKIDLLRARQQITLTLPLKLVGFKAQVGDIIQVNNTRFGWTAKKFEVTNSKISFDEFTIGVDLDLREIDDTVFDWDADEEQTFDPSPNTNLPDPYTVGVPTDLTITATNVPSPDGAIQSGLLVTWTPPTNSFVDQYEVQYIRGASSFDLGSVANNATTTTNYGYITTTADTSADYGYVSDETSAGEVDYSTVFVTTPKYVIVPAIAGVEYAVRVCAMNVLGVRSAFVTSNEITYGDTEAPDVPSEIVAVGGYKQITLSWINPSVSDFDYVEVYRNTINNSGSSTRVGVLRGSKFVDTGLGMDVTRFYWLKSVDRSGNKSDFSNYVTATTEFIDSDSFSQEVLNLFSEAGAYGIEPVSSLPTAGDFDGQIKYNTALNKLYRWDAGTSSWTDDIFSITTGSVDIASFAAGIEPVGLVDELPNVSGYTGPKVVFLTSDNKMYRYTGTAWISSIAAADIDGTLGTSNFSQSLRPVEVVNALPSTGNFAGRTVVLTTDSKLYRYTGEQWTASVPTDDLSGTIGADQIAANAITAGKIAADAVTSGTIAAGAISADNLSANCVTAGKIAASAISATEIATDAITSEKIAADAIIASKIAAEAIQTDHIAANQITGGLLSTAGVITVSAQIDNSIITNAHIQNLAVDTLKIQDEAVSVVSRSNQYNFNTTDVTFRYTFDMPSAGSFMAVFVVIPQGTAGTSSQFRIDLTSNNIPGPSPLADQHYSNGYVSEAIKTITAYGTRDAGNGYWLDVRSVLTNFSYNSSGNRGARVDLVLFRRFK